MIHRVTEHCRRRNQFSPFRCEGTAVRDLSSLLVSEGQRVFLILGNGRVNQSRKSGVHHSFHLQPLFCSTLQ